MRTDEVLPISSKIDSTSSPYIDRHDIYRRLIFETFGCPVSKWPCRRIRWHLTLTSCGTCKSRSIKKSTIQLSTKLRRLSGLLSIGIVPSLYLSLTCSYGHHVHEIPDALVRCGATPAETKSVLRCLLREYIDSKDRKEGENIAQKMVKIQYLKPFYVAALLLPKGKAFEMLVERIHRFHAEQDGK